MNKQTTAVVDRISEGKFAVILAEEINKEFIIPIEKATIPLRPGLWLDITLNEKNQIETMQANETLTNEKAQSVSNMMEKLRKRKGSKYKS